MNTHYGFYQLFVYVPATYLNQVKEALFNAGAGQLGNYDRCSWQTAGQGQFRPLSGAQPFTGQTDRTEQLEEYRLEMLVPRELAQPVIDALKTAHPYETPAYGLIPVFT